VVIESSTACGSQTGPPPYDYRDVGLGLPDATFLPVADELVRICEPRVGRWHRSAEPDISRRRWRSLQASIEAPSEAHVDSVLSYVVTLTNSGQKAVTLDPCPGYLQGLRLTKSGGSYALNCAEAPQIGAGQTVRFEMRLQVQDVPPIQGPTDAELTWKMWDGPQAPTHRILILR
jgi:hypothetical protein